MSGCVSRNTRRIFRLSRTSATTAVAWHPSRRIAASQPALNLCRIDPRDPAREQIGKLDLPQIREADLPVEDPVDARNDADLTHARLAGLRYNAPDNAGRRGRHRDENRLYAVAADERR